MGFLDRVESFAEKYCPLEAYDRVASARVDSINTALGRKSLESCSSCIDADVGVLFALKKDIDDEA